MNDIQRKHEYRITLKKYKWELAWVLYISVIALYIYFCINSSNTMWVQIGIFTLTVAAMILIMLHSSSYQRKLTAQQIKAVTDSTDKQIVELKKLTNSQINATQKASENQINKVQESTQVQIEAIKESTDRQVAVLVEQFKGVGDKLEKIASAWTMESKERTELQKKANELEEQRRHAETEQLRVLKLESDRRLKERQNRIQLMKPLIYSKIERKNYMLFWEHYWLSFRNMGAEGSHMKINSMIFAFGTPIGTMFTQKYESIKHEETVSFDCGNIDNFRAFDMVEVKVTIQDSENRVYEGVIQYSRDSNEWVEVPLQLQNDTT